MNKKLFIFVLGFCFLSVCAFSREGFDVENAKKFITQKGAFDLKAEIIEGQTTLPGQVDSVVKFNISSTAVVPGTVTLYYFLDNQFSGLYENVVLPYIFAQSYRGLNNGNHSVSFVVETTAGKYAGCAMPINVKHK